MTQEFPNDSADDMDDAAVRILVRNMRSGRSEAASQEDQIRADLARFNATGELPEAWAPEIDDEQLDEINRDPEIAAHLAELDAIESGCAEPPAGGWITGMRVSR
jgi:hypothetical protein